MATQLPPDEVQMEQALRAAIRDTLMSVALIPANAKIHLRERFPENDDRDIELTTMPDKVVPANRVVSVIQIGIPTVEEAEYTGDECTQLNFTYPISFDMQVVDEWDNPGATLEFTNSQDLFTAIYMRARRAFKKNRTLGYVNCAHEYLQQPSAVTVEDEDTKARLHVADWSLTVKCTGVNV
jgi:hypothetical protein